uniref:Actin-related protein 5 n=1 Tax=Anthurium amnicola TaxID=1678845 RepID=A0A1D1ZHY1_9ARAE
MASRPSQQSDYRRFSPAVPIVIDNGSSCFRIGWAGESDPRVSFRNIVHRPRHKASGETFTIVGDFDPALMKFFDCTRSPSRSPFDNNVVYQFETMEYVLDFGFERLGADGPEVNHPVLMTECMCNPVASRSKMAELLFETYGVPSIAFGIDAAFSYKYNQQLGICNEDGIAVCSGFTTSHVIPFVKGEPVIDACCRTNVGGYNITEYLKQLLSLKYPNHMNSITWEKAEDLKKEHCYIALDYASELKLFQKGTKEAEQKTRCWQLPWVPPPQEEPPSEEELARKAALKEKQVQRLREMAAAKRLSKIADLESELNALENLLNQLDTMEDDEVSAILYQRGYASREEIESAALKVAQSLRKAKGEAVEAEEKVDASLEERYSLINVSDNMLTQEQLKEKRKQIFLKTTSEGRMRARQKKFEEELQKERQNQEEEEKRLENPELYLEQLRCKYKELSEKVEQRKRPKTNGTQTNGNGLNGGVGRGERLNAAQRERMRLLTTAALDRGKGEDTFGAKEEDWQLYKLMSRDNDDDDNGHDEGEVELARIASRLQEIDPTFIAKSDTHSLQDASPEIARIRPLTAEDFQIVFGVERFRCPEILFQPNMVGVDQCGLDEMTGVSLRRLSVNDEGIKESMCESILMIGGSCLLPGMGPRLEADIRKIRPYLSPLQIVRASDPILDAWRGAALYAASLRFPEHTFSRQDYYEKGEDWLRGYRLRYNI